MIRMSAQSTFTYGEGIRKGFEHVLTKYSDCFVMGQGLWSPWYVGNTMTDLEKTFGKDRVIDCPVSESATTGIAFGASLTGKKAIIVHPRMDFSLYAMDMIVNQIAKWRYMFGGNAETNITIRLIINRGGEQGAQHSQALHSFFCHVPGLRVVMPYTVEDAMNLLVASVECPDPVIYIDDRWLYEHCGSVSREVSQMSLKNMVPNLLRAGSDICLIGSGYTSFLCEKAAIEVEKFGLSATVLDLRAVSPIDWNFVTTEVKSTGRLLVVDGGWATCGLSAEIIASIYETVNPSAMKSVAKRVTLPFSPAPTSVIQEQNYYPSVKMVVDQILEMMNS